MAEIDTKLISVEGIPGSGKSETARFITDFLVDNSRHAAFFEENDMNHPAEYTFHALMKDSQIKTLTLEEQRQLYDEGTKALSGLIIPLTKISVSLFGKVVPYKIYDNLEWETENPVILERWQGFSKKAAMRNKVYVFNSGVLQNPISEMMLRFDFAYSYMRDYLFNVYRTIAAMNPVVIYIKCTDIKACVEEEARHRNSDWLNGMIEHHTAQGYGKRNNFKDFDGYIDCLEARQRIEIKLLNDLPFEKLILTDPFNNWSDTRSRICEYLKSKTARLITR